MESTNLEDSGRETENKSFMKCNRTSDDEVSRSRLNDDPEALSSDEDEVLELKTKTVHTLFLSKSLNANMTRATLTLTRFKKTKTKSVITKYTNSTSKI